MSAIANEEYQLKKERRELLRHLDELYTDRTNMTDADIFDDENIVSFDDVIKLTTGQRISSYSAFRHSQNSRNHINKQSEELANLLEAGGIKARIDDGNKLFMKTHVTGVVVELPKYRNINFLPVVAQRNRRDMLKDFEYFMTTNSYLKNARYFVITAGPRVPFDNKKDSLRTTIEAFKRRLQRWRNETCAAHDVSVIFQGIEFTRDDDDKSYHVHANVVIVPPEHMLKTASNAYTRFYVETQEFLDHFRDDGKIEALRDFVKYPFKIADLEGIDSKEAVWLYHNTFKLRMFEALDSFKEFCKTRREQKLCIVRIARNLHLRPSGTLLVERKPAKDEKEDKKSREKLKNHVLGVMTPGFYATPWKESATLIINYDENDRSTTNRDFNPDDLHKHQSRSAWHSSNAPDPDIALKIAGYILNADDHELEMIEDYEREIISNVHSNTITSNSENRDQNNPFEHDPDPPDFDLNPSGGYQKTHETKENTPTSTEDEDAYPNFLAIFDDERPETEEFHFRGELLQRDIVEDYLRETL